MTPGSAPLLAETVHMKGPLPEAVNCCVPSALSAIAAGDTARGWAAVTMTVTVADFVVSSCEVAVTVTLPVELDAVNVLPLNVPALAFQVTAPFCVKL